MMLFKEKTITTEDGQTYNADIHEPSLLGLLLMLHARTLKAIYEDLTTYSDDIFMMKVKKGKPRLVGNQAFIVRKILDFRYSKGIDSYPASYLLGEKGKQYENPCDGALLTMEDLLDNLCLGSLIKVFVNIVNQGAYEVPNDNLGPYTSAVVKAGEKRIQEYSEEGLSFLLLGVFISGLREQRAGGVDMPFATDIVGENHESQMTVPMGNFEDDIAGDPQLDSVWYEAFEDGPEPGRKE